MLGCRIGPLVKTLIEFLNADIFLVKVRPAWVTVPWPELLFVAKY